MARLLTALVIGNATYQYGDVLRNPVNDAHGITTALRMLGFSITTLTNAKTEEMDRALADFGVQLGSSDVGLFFFAGHAFQIDGINFLAGIDTKADTKISLQYSSLHLDKVIGTMKEAATPTNLVILDACRNNPFDLVLHRSGSLLELAPINAPKGTLIAYSTSPGQKSRDGSNQNGSYTEALLQHITTEGIPIETMFKRVRSTLEALTGGAQVSWEHTSLTGDFRFRLRADPAVSEYGRTALADGLFALHNSKVAHQLIRALKSYSWYTQNPALESFSTKEAEVLTPDELFVIGRNIYQAACGSSNEAEKYIRNFLDRTAGLDQSQRKPLLDGMLYEVFFDSEGQFRANPKMGFFDPLFQLQQFPDLSTSFAFLLESLRPYAERYYVLPGSGAEVSVDVATTRRPDSEIFDVAGVWYESSNILHGGSEDEVDSWSPRDLKLNPEEFTKFITNEMLIPKQNLNVRFNFSPTQNTRFVIPAGKTIRRDT